LVDACCNECEIDFCVWVVRWFGKSKKVAVKTYVFPGTENLRIFEESTSCWWYKILREGDSIEFSLGCFCFSDDSDFLHEIYVCFVLQPVGDDFFMCFGVAVASLFFVLVWNLIESTHSTHLTRCTHRTHIHDSNPRNWWWKEVDLIYIL
jgi:hypothetical protein